MAALALPIRDNADVIKLLDLLNAPGFQAEKQGFISLISYVDVITEQYNNIMTELSDVKDRLGDMGGKKNPLTVMVEHLSNVVSSIGEKLKALKDSIVEFAQNTIDAAKDKGLSALGAVSETLHLHEGLESISKSLGQAAAKCENLEKFHHDRVESKLLTEFEIPADLDSLSNDELKIVYDKLLDMGMNADLSSCENAIVQDLMEEIEAKLPELGENAQAHEIEAEADQGAEM